MPRPRTNDPLGVSDHPKNLVTDPVRVKAAVLEFRQKLIFVEGIYKTTSRAIGSNKDFNRSLAKLQRSIARTRPAKRRGDRAHPEIEIVILKHAMDHAATRTGQPDSEITQEDADFGARKAAQLLKPRRGRSSNSLLRYYVEGLMALIQQLTGKPVLLTLNKDNLYDPQAVNTGGKILVMLAQQLEPTATVSTIASMAKQARRKYAHERMRFLDFFPHYGASPPRLDQSPDPESVFETLLILPFCPIYFP